MVIKKSIFCVLMTSLVFVYGKNENIGDEENEIKEYNNLKHKHEKTRLELETLLWEKEKLDAFVDAKIKEKQVNEDLNKNGNFDKIYENSLLRIENRIIEAKIKNLELQETLRKLEKEKMIKESRSANVKIKYLKEPYDKKTKVLTVSDRVIEIVGEINSDVADRVEKYIDFYNNKDKTFPIFVIIKDSIGGFVNPGLRIVNKIKGSCAPIYVVVKERAYSTAAIIACAATKSFCYKQTEIMHHLCKFQDAYYFDIKNVQENDLNFKEKTLLFISPLLEKMGISLDDFIKKSYEKKSSGEWSEFGEEAVKLKWVDYLVSDIKMTAINEI